MGVGHLSGGGGSHRSIAGPSEPRGLMSVSPGSETPRAAMRCSGTALSFPLNEVSRGERAVADVGCPCPGHGGGGVPVLGNTQSCLETHLQMGELRPIKATKTRSKYPAQGCSHCFWEQGTGVGGMGEGGH